MASASSLFNPTVELRMVFVVLGTPIPKGSMRSYGFINKAGQLRAATTNDNEKTRPWQQQIAREAFLMRGHNGPILEPVVLELDFYFQPPKAFAKGRSRLAPAVSRNDLDKLQRAVMDGLKAGGIYKDDGQVVDIVARKRFAGGWGDPHGTSGLPRAAIKVGRLV